MENATMKEIKAFLQKKGCKTSFKNKKEALAFIDKLSWTDSFPWNSDQQVVLSWEKNQKYREHVVQGTFGSGKSTMMLGIYLRKITQTFITPKQILVCAFNISIKNELKKKIRELGFKEKPQVRTFDSMIFEICSHYDLPGLDKPDYEGRRTFVEKQMAKGLGEDNPFTGYEHIQLVLVDEVQDLDQKALLFFRTFFPNARFYFFGDVFQCIQKEPRCSLLWQLLKPSKDRIIHFMQKTPRVPTPILNEIKTALIHHYPEYQIQIQNWYSSNPVSDTQIEWIPFRQYGQIFDLCKEFLQTHDPAECMVLTFSSAITVKGNMGDLSRFRQFFQKEGIAVNRNYKSMEEGKLFLSTVNSSKGLERKHVFIALTFPLEKAFANFSNNLVVNLVSVGLSRCKQDVKFLVPIYEDRYSEVLNLYPKCPSPQKDAGPTIHKLKSSQEGISVKDFLTRSHSATEIIRQNILSFETRNRLRSNAKMVNETPSFPPGQRIKWRMRNEEEASFMGILFEVLITSTWSKRWPLLDPSFMGEVMNNPLYGLYRRGITSQFQKLVRSFRIPFESHRDRFSVLYEYTQHHILLTQKIRVRISENRKDEMRQAWRQLERDIRMLCPNGKMKAQVNLKRPFMTGVADLVVEQEGQDPIVYEIKTCSTSDWKDNAFTQAALYCAMSKRNKATIRLFNPFRRELFEYKICLTPTENNKTLSIVEKDLLLWNLNCFLSKYPKSSTTDVDMSSIVCWENGIGVEWLAPTKTRHSIYSQHQYEIQGKRIIGWKATDIKSISPSSSIQGDLLEWFLDQLEFEREENDWLDFEEDFVKVVLLSCWLKINL